MFYLFYIPNQFKTFKITQKHLWSWHVEKIVWKINQWATMLALYGKSGFVTVTVKRVLFAGVNFRDIEITANSRFLIFAVDRIKILKNNNKVLVLVY